MLLKLEFQNIHVTKFILSFACNYNTFTTNLGVYVVENFVLVQTEIDTFFVNIFF